VEVSRIIRDVVKTSAPSSGSPGKILTLSPVYAIESDLPIYPELATGSFVFRIGDRLSQEERERYHATSVSTIGDLLDADPPAAILVGDEGELENPLLDYAQKHNYAPYDDELAGGRLFIR
jgi:hypothetical protein